MWWLTMFDLGKCLWSDVCISFGSRLLVLVHFVTLFWSITRLSGKFHFPPLFRTQSMFDSRKWVHVMTHYVHPCTWWVVMQTKMNWQPTVWWLCGWWCTECKNCTECKIVWMQHIWLIIISQCCMLFLMCSVSTLYPNAAQKEDVVLQQYVFIPWFFESL